jgi:hypothetical protein
LAGRLVLAENSQKLWCLDYVLDRKVLYSLEAARSFVA